MRACVPLTAQTGLLTTVRGTLRAARMVAFVRGARPAASPSPATRLTAPEARVSSRASEVSTGGRPARSSVGATFSNFST